MSAPPVYSSSPSKWHIRDASLAMVASMISQVICMANCLSPTIRDIAIAAGPSSIKSSSSRSSTSSVETVGQGETQGRALHNYKQLNRSDRKGGGQVRRQQLIAVHCANICQHSIGKLNLKPASWTVSQPASQLDRQAQAWRLSLGVLNYLRLLEAGPIGSLTLATCERLLGFSSLQLNNTGKQWAV